MDRCINIADFRCRDLTRATTSAKRSQCRPRGFEIVSGEDELRAREIELLREAVLKEDPMVYDIGIAREAQRLRRRVVFRPISIQRKAKVLRFRDEPPFRVAESWSGIPEGPSDQPPAA
jgi:hypothetical protein